jgi:methyl-accepting chemotaxis protein
MKGLRKSLKIKVISSLVVLFACVLGGIIFVNVSGQKEQVISQVQDSIRMLIDTVYNGMIYPMSIGDEKTIRQQMRDFKASMEGVEIAVFGFNRNITYASEEEKEGLNLFSQIHSDDLSGSIDLLIKNGELPRSAFEEIIEGDHYLTLVRPILNQKLCHHCHGSSHQILGGLMVRKNNEHTYASLSALQKENLIIGLIGSLLTVLLVYFLITKLVTNPVKEIKCQAEAIAQGDLTRWLKLKSQDELGDLTDSFIQTTRYLNKTIGIVEESSLRLAEGASEQASAVEETSSSMEQILATMKNNAEKGREGKSHMDETKEIVTEAKVSMDELIGSLEETSAASDDIGKIIKTIQELAFQTNLLALNAAVEAARAGDAGSGFAVVAEEVRNLAMRSAKAAQDTEKLIENIIGKIKRGTDLVRETDSRYREVVDSTNRITELISEIIDAIQEQSDGIGQIKKAMDEIEKVSQNNSASAEELTSSISIFKTRKISSKA